MSTKHMILFRPSEFFQLFQAVLLRETGEGKGRTTAISESKEPRWKSVHRCSKHPRTMCVGAARAQNRRTSHLHQPRVPRRGHRVDPVHHQNEAALCEQRRRGLPAEESERGEPQSGVRRACAATRVETGCVHCSLICPSGTRGLALT